MRERSLVSVRKNDHDWLKSTATRLNIKIIDVIQALIERQQRVGELTDIDRIEEKRALDRIRRQKERLLQEEQRLIGLLNSSTKRRQKAAIPTYDGENVNEPL